MTRRITRRQLGIGAGATAVTGAGTAGVWLSGGMSRGRPGRFLPSQLPLPTPYTLPFRVPPVLQPERTVAAADHYEITQQVSRHEIIPGHQTSMWTYAGQFPGPTIDCRSGREVVVTHRNHLSVPTVVHLHGGHTPHASDGYPTDLLQPVAGAAPPTSLSRLVDRPPSAPDPEARVRTGTRDYTYPLQQRAATLWYHDHRMDFTGLSVWRGLAGFQLVHDDEEDALGLPDGDRDVPMMVCDRSFDADGQLNYPLAHRWHNGMLGVTEPYSNGVIGDVILVNGVPWPLMKVAGARYRLRILNASNARQYTLALDPPPPGGSGFVQVGSDGGLLAHPVEHDTIHLAPAERFDIVVDFAKYAPGTRVKLLNRQGSGGASQVMAFEVGRRVHDTSRVPHTLSHITAYDPRRATVHRSFVFQKLSGRMWGINSTLFDPSRSLAGPRLDDLEVWTFTGDLAHPVHVHLDPFQVLSRNGHGPGPMDSGWKDTVDLQPAEAVQVAIKFGDHAGRYVFHCHNLEHEDMGMMANFTTHT